MSDIAISIISMIGVLIPAILLHKREVKKYEDHNTELKKENKEYEIKISFFDRIMDFTSINVIKDSVDRIFSQTSADRFLILIAINGKTDFNIVSVIFEQHKNQVTRINAIARYRNVHIDSEYRAMLKDTERNGMIHLEIEKMADSLLKEFYYIENVKHSLIKHLVRKPIDKNNDFLVFSSIATHSTTGFSKRSKVIINQEYDATIIPNLKKVLD